MAEGPPAIERSSAWRWYSAAALVAALVLLLGYRAHEGYRSLLVGSFQTQQSLFLLSLQSAVVDHFNEEELDLRHAAREMRSRGASPAVATEVLGNIYASHSEDFISIALFDAAGELRTAVPSVGIWGPRLRDAVRAAAAEHGAAGTFVTEAFVNEAGVTGLALGVPFEPVPGGEREIVVGALQIEDFMLRHFPAWRGRSLGFALVDDDGHLLSLLTTAHESGDAMQHGNIRTPGPACLRCHTPRDFADLVRSFAKSGVNHSVFTAPGGMTTNRATLSFPIYNDRWSLAVLSPYESVQLAIDRNLRVTLGLGLLFALAVGIAVWTGGERGRLREAVREGEAVRASEERFRAVFDNANDGILIVDPAGTILDANRTLYERLGYLREDLVGRTIASIDDPESAAKVPERLAGIAERGRAVFVSAHRRRDGTVMPVEVNARAMTIAGRPVFLSVIRDITERVAAERALRRYAEEVEEANRLKDLFNDIVRHDLLNPLSVARGYAELLPAAEGAPETQLVLSLRRSLERLAELIRSAAHLSRLMETERLDRTEQDLGEVIAEAVRLFERELAEGGWRVELPPAGPRPIRASPVLVEVFSNLVANAIKFSETVRRIQITVADAGASWVVAVSDWGPGITREDRERAFTRFERLGSRGTKGMGLGLAIAKRIVDLHRGSIGIEENPEGGCVFRVELPKDGAGRA